MSTSFSSVAFCRVSAFSLSPFSPRASACFFTRAFSSSPISAINCLLGSPTIWQNWKINIKNSSKIDYETLYKMILWDVHANKQILDVVSTSKGWYCHKTFVVFWPDAFRQAGWLISGCRKVSEKKNLTTDSYTLKSTYCYRFCSYKVFVEQIHPEAVIFSK